MFLKSTTDESYEEGTFAHWFIDVWTNSFFRLVGVNVLFLIACIPVVTIPAALCGLHGVVQNFYRKRYINTTFETFKSEFFSHFFSKTIIYLSVFIIPIAVFLIMFYTNVTTVLITICAFLLLCALITVSWFIPQLVMLNLRPSQAVKNALIFTCIETKTNFCLMVIYAVELSVMVFLLPLSVFFLLILPVLHTVIVTHLTVPTISKYLVRV